MTLYKQAKSVFLHLNIHYTFINHDGFLEMDANVIAQVSRNAVKMQH